MNGSFPANVGKEREGPRAEDPRVISISRFQTAAPSPGLQDWTPPVVPGLAVIIAEQLEHIKNIRQAALSYPSLDESDLDIRDGRVYLSWRF